DPPHHGPAATCPWQAASAGHKQLTIKLAVWGQRTIRPPQLTRRKALQPAPWSPAKSEQVHAQPRGGVVASCLVGPLGGLGTGRRMRRREFIGFVGGVVAWPLAARAQQRSLPVVGYYYPGHEDEGASVLTPAFRKGLSELGFVEGRNVAIEYR